MQNYGIRPMEECTVLERHVVTFKGDAAWKTPGRTGQVRVACAIRSQDNIALYFSWNEWQYMAWLDRSESDTYVGVYEVNTAGMHFRGKANCFAKRVDGELELEGTFEGPFHDFAWQGKLREVTTD